MPLTLPSKSADYAPPPEGTLIGVCYRALDLGTQETTYMGAIKRQHLILISWELPEERMNDGRPFSISRRYTYSSHAKSNLRKDLENWRGQKFTDADFGEFDLGRLLGVGCLLNIVHEEKGENLYANITAIMRLPRGTKTPAVENDMIVFSLSDRPFNHVSWGKLGERLQETIKKSPEYKAAIEGRDPNETDDGTPLPSEGDYGARYGDDLDDSIPFISCAISDEPAVRRMNRRVL